MVYNIYKCIYPIVLLYGRYILTYLQPWLEKESYGLLFFEPWEFSMVKYSKLTSCPEKWKPLETPLPSIELTNFSWTNSVQPPFFHIFPRVSFAAPWQVFIYFDDNSMEPDSRPSRPSTARTFWRPSSATPNPRRPWTGGSTGGVHRVVRVDMAEWLEICWFLQQWDTT